LSQAVNKGLERLYRASPRPRYRCRNFAAGLPAYVALERATAGTGASRAFDDRLGLQVILRDLGGDNRR
jgi:hypothetical protein